MIRTKICALCAVIGWLLLMSSCSGSLALSTDKTSTETPLAAVRTEKIGGYRLTLPDGWKELEDVEGFYVGPNYPEDRSNISVTVTEKTGEYNGMFNKAGAEELRDQFEKLYSLTTGEDTKVEIEEYGQCLVDGYSALSLLLTTELSGTDCRQLVYMVEADELYVFSFTQF